MLLKNIKKIIIILMSILTLTACSYVGENIKHNISKSVKNTENKIQQNFEFNEKESPDFYKIIGKVDESNLPNLKVGEIIYEGLDNLKRTQSVKARLSYENYKEGKQKRKDISEFKPSGWVKNKIVKLKFYDGTIYNGHFYNRSHLLAHSLGGRDSIENLITGTRPQNVGKNNQKGGMQYIETKVLNWLKENPKGYCYYIITPKYNGHDLVPYIVEVEALSSDKTINEKVIIYNVAPNYEIDYSTGNYYEK